MMLYMERIEICYGIGSVDRQEAIAVAESRLVARATEICGGSTILPGRGQWLDEKGDIVDEPCRVLVLYVERGRAEGASDTLREECVRFCDESGEACVLFCRGTAGALIFGSGSGGGE